MKKFLIITAIFLLTAAGVYAAPGDVIGEVYSTDILAFINGSPINSYNIGGRTVIIAEDLCNNSTGEHYGFDCVYDDQSRTLTLTSGFTKGNASADVTRGSVGEIVGTVYETDIRVFFNSYEITGYNIGGQTAICIEDLGAYDESEPNAAFGYSKYLCNAVWNAETREITLNTYLQDKNYFDSYPKRKLAFDVKDNIISCSFDQLNPYSGSVDFEFSDEFKENVYRITPVYFGENVVGQVVMTPNGTAAFNMNDRLMHMQTNSLEKVLTYGEAVEYIVTNFEVVTEKQVAGATVYLAKNDGIYYLLFAMSDGGLVCESKYDLSYSVVELITNDDGVLCLNLKSDTFSGEMPVSTEGYEFDDNYEKFVGSSLADSQRMSSRVGVAEFTVDDTPYIIDALYNGAVFVDIDAACELLGIDCFMYGGIFYLTKAPVSHKISVAFDSASGKLPASVGIMSSSDIYVNSEKKSVSPALYFYNGRVYAAADFFTGLYQ